mmetsp:Transcript_45136/g.52060  ORF Transcript_45136/g.52060 Transcript_45136/m.52060 type:complete len:95 (-) Transcript_45136:43-327(-)
MMMMMNDDGQAHTIDHDGLIDVVSVSVLTTTQLHTFHSAYVFFLFHDLSKSSVFSFDTAYELSARWCCRRRLLFLLLFLELLTISTPRMRYCSE